MADRTVEQHLAAVLAVARPLPPATVPLPEAAGLVAGADVECLVDLPGFDNSAMDGYAVRAADLLGATSDAPVRLSVVADLAAGDAPSRVIGPGEAARIMTGAMIPEGVDTIVKVEDTDAGMPLVGVLVETPLGTSIRRRGEDLPAGGPVVAAGTVLTPRHIGLLAAAGHASVAAHPRPRVAVVSTGAELVAPGEPVQPGQIHDSNSYLLAALVDAAGGLTAYRGTVGDRPDEVRDLLDHLATEVDVIVTSGGVSMGVHDVVKGVLRERAEVDFVTVAMQPGKPQGFGVLGERRVPFFGLPGNPVAVTVTFYQFVRSALATLQGRTDYALPPTVKATLTNNVKKMPGRTEFQRGVLTIGPNGCEVKTTGDQGSGILSSMTQANCFVVLGTDVGNVAAGAVVDVQMFEGVV